MYPKEAPSNDGDDAVEASGVIAVYIRELDQLFDSLDPSPFHEKSLDRGAHDHIVQLAKELPSDGPVSLVVYLAQPIGLEGASDVLQRAIRVYFARLAEAAARNLRQQFRQGWISLVIGLTLLVASVAIGETVARRLGNSPLAVVLRESLLIGGWVAMWRPMDFFLYEWWQLKRERRLYERLGQIDVRIVYTGERAPTREPVAQET